MSIARWLGFVLILFCSGCLSNEPEYVKAAYQVRNDYVKRVSPKYEIKCEGYGESFMGDVKVLQVMFTVPRKMNVDQARLLAVSVTQEFLKEINCNERVRPYLHNYPFTSKNVKISFAFNDPYTGKRYASPSVALIWVARGGVGYSKHNPDTPPNKMSLERFHNEDYQEALEIVRSQYPNDPLYQ